MSGWGISRRIARTQKWWAEHFLCICASIWSVFCSNCIFANLCQVRKVSLAKQEIHPVEVSWVYMSFVSGIISGVQLSLVELSFWYNQWRWGELSFISGNDNRWRWRQWCSDGQAFLGKFIGWCWFYNVALNFRYMWSHPHRTRMDL